MGWFNSKNEKIEADRELKKEIERENITIQDIEMMIAEMDLTNIIGALENSGIDALLYYSLKEEIAFNEKLRNHLFMEMTPDGEHMHTMSTINRLYPIITFPFPKMNLRYQGKELLELCTIEGNAKEKLELVGRMNNSDIQPIVDYFTDRINNKSEDIWYKSIRILGFIGNEKVVKTLYAILNEADNERRGAVIKALHPLYKRTKNQQILQFYITSLGNSKITGELWAIRALANIGNLLAVKPLINAISTLNLEDTDQKITAENIADALANIEALNGGKESFVTDLIKFKEKGMKNIDLALKAMTAEDVGIEYEKLEMYEEANKWYSTNGLLEEAASARRKKAGLNTSKTIIENYVDDRDTIIKDSVINRSNIGGRKTKGERIKLIKELLDSGAIDDAEFKQMKKEILGK